MHWISHDLARAHAAALDPIERVLPGREVLELNRAPYGVRDPSLDMTSYMHGSGSIRTEARRIGW